MKRDWKNKRWDEHEKKAWYTNTMVRTSRLMSRDDERWKTRRMRLDENIFFLLCWRAFFLCKGSRAMDRMVWNLNHQAGYPSNSIVFSLIFFWFTWRVPRCYGYVYDYGFWLGGRDVEFRHALGGMEDDSKKYDLRATEHSFHEWRWEWTVHSSIGYLWGSWYLVVMKYIHLSMHCLLCVLRFAFCAVCCVLCVFS